MRIERLLYTLQHEGDEGDRGREVVKLLRVQQGLKNGRRRMHIWLVVIVVAALVTDDGGGRVHGAMCGSDTNDGGRGRDQNNISVGPGES